MAMTRQQLEQQLVAAHRTKNVQAAQQAAYAIRAYDQNVLSAQVPIINAPPPIERVPKPTFGSWLENVTTGIGEGLGEQVQGLGGAIQRGVTAFAQDPLKASAAAFMTALEPARQGFTQPVQAAKDIGTGIVETGKQMYQQATSGPVGLGQTIGQMIDLPGPSLSGGKRRPTMAELDVYHGTPHTFDPETGASLGRFRSEKIGTGGGAQAYGYGLYLAEEPQVAKQYVGGGDGFISTQGKDNIYLDGELVKDFYDKKSAEGLAKYSMSQSSTGTTIPEKVETLKKIGRQDAAEWLEKNQNRFNVSKGSLYKLDLPDAMIEQMLDWDKSLLEQPENVRNALKRRITDVQPIDKFDMGGGSRLRDNRMGQYDKTKPYPWILEANSGNGTSAFGLTQKDVDRMFGGKDASSLTGEQIISRLAVTQGSQAAASEYLRSLGIPGIKYLDAGSRGGEKGTRNFVVFPGEEQSLTILERDGVKAEVPKAGGPKFDLSVDSAKGIRETKVGNTQISYEYDGNIASIASIRTPSGKRNQGSARTAMEQFLAETDALGIPVKLESSPLDKRTTDARLFNFYKSLGFEPTGRKINAVGDPEMIRQPRTN